MANEGETAAANEVATKPVGRPKAERAAAAVPAPAAVLSPASALGGPAGAAPVAVTPKTALAGTDASSAAAVGPLVVPEEYFEVLEDIEVPNGASTFPLRRGQKLKAGHYDIEHLRGCGVKLREAAAPVIVRQPVMALPRVVAVAAGEPAPDVIEDSFEVLESIDVPRDEAGMGTFRLSAGQRIKRGQYDIAKLEEHGVRMKIVVAAVKPVAAAPPHA